MNDRDVDETSGGTLDGNGSGGTRSDPPDEDDNGDRSAGPGPEREASGETHQDAGLDGGAAQAAQGQDERVGEGD